MAITWREQKKILSKFTKVSAQMSSQDQPPNGPMLVIIRCELLFPKQTHQMVCYTEPSGKEPLQIENGRHFQKILGR